MSRKFMKIKKVTLSILTVAIIASQLAGCAVMSESNLMAEANDSPTMEIEIAMPDEETPGSSETGIESQITYGDQQEEAGSTEAAGEATIVEKLDPSTLSDDEKLEIFTKVYEFSYQVEEILRGARGEAEINQEEMREQGLIYLNKSLSELGYKVTSEIKEEYIFWSDTYHPFDDSGSTVSSETKTQQSTGGGTQQTTNENKQQNNNTTTQSSTTNKSNSQIESTTPPVNDNNTSTEESQVETGSDTDILYSTGVSVEDWLNDNSLPDTDPKAQRAHF